MRKFLALILLSGPLFGQQAVNQSDGPTPNNYVNLFFYDGSNNLAYVCSAPGLQAVSTFYRSSSTLTNIVVTSNVGVITFSSTSYLWVGARITVAGSTTAALNGTYPVTAVSGSTASIATSGVGDATYNNAAMTVYTSAPLLNSAIWAIKALTYTSTTLTGTRWLGTPAVVVPHTLLCSSRATY